MKTCKECTWNKHIDEGYGEYTITGATYSCILKKRPDINDDGPPEDEVRAKCEFAETCDSFRAGTNLFVGMDSAYEPEEWQSWAEANFPMGNK